MQTSSTATRSRNNVSGGAWLPKGTNMKEMMLIFSSVVNKIFIALVALLFKHALCRLVTRKVKTFPF
jgi:hypothetical protein